MKFNNLLKGVALGGVVLGATTLFAGCNIFKEKEKGGSAPTYINQTYSAIVANVGTEPIMTSSQSNDWEKDVVSVKLKENNVAYLVYDLMAYQGAWAENKDTSELDFNITITDDEIEYVVEMVIDGESTIIKDKANSPELVGTTPIELGKKSDILFENGLYVGLGSYTSRYDFDLQQYVYSYSTEIEDGAYTYKLSDNEIYSCDDVCEAYELYVECVGDQLIYSAKYDRAGEDGETNLFFVEKKGEHNAEFVNAFGDLDYVIYHVENEGGRTHRYYETKATSATTTLEITQNITFNATKLFKEEYYAIDPQDYFTYENVNMQLDVKTDGTITLTITGNEKYNMTTNGKWYNIGQNSAQGLLIVLDNKDFFGGYFALGTYDDDDITIQHFLEDEVTSSIHTTDGIVYKIGWNEESEAEILSRADWILKNN